MPPGSITRFCSQVARPPQPEEAERLLMYLDHQRALFESDQSAVVDLLGETASDAVTAERAAWVALSSVLLNLDEFLTRE